MLAFEWTAALGTAGIATEMDFENRSLKSQMKRADRLGAAFVVLVGDDELERGEAILRDMESSRQETLPLSDAVERIRKRLLG
jgi:histidyl-tRNA synthetase